MIYKYKNMVYIILAVFIILYIGFTEFEFHGETKSKKISIKIYKKSLLKLKFDYSTSDLKQ